MKVYKYENKVNKNDIDFKLISYAHENTSKINLYSNNGESLIRYKTLKKDEQSLQQQRECNTLILFLFFLFIVILTLSQILIMHNQTNNTNFYQIKLMQEELKLMDKSIDKMLKENGVLPMQLWYSLKQYKDNIKKFQNYLNFISNYSSCENFIINSNRTSEYNNRTIELWHDKKNIECLQNFLMNTTNLFDRTKMDNDKFILNASKTDNFHLISMNVVSNLNKSLKIKNYCNELPSDLLGPINVDDKKLNADFLSIVEQENDIVELGGKWKPSDCQSRHRVPF